MSAAQPECSKAKPLCRYFLAGDCWYGASCRFSHDAPRPQGKQTAPLCSFFLKGCCMLGDKCRFSHDEDALRAKPCDLEQSEEGEDIAERVTCGICLEEMDVQGIATTLTSAAETRSDSAEDGAMPTCNSGCAAPEPGASGAKEESHLFGLLIGCDHAFCFKCIQGWRRPSDKAEATKARRTCPVCREHSDYVVPSHRFCRGGEKEAVVQRFLASRAKIPCKYFSSSGCCPFRDDCMFAHIADDGTHVTGVTAPPKPPRAMSASDASRGERLRDMLLQLIPHTDDEQGPHSMIHDLIEQLEVMQYS